MPLKDHKDTWATIGSIVQVFAIVVGAAFATYKYLETEKSTRTKESLAFLDRYHKNPIYDARISLEKVWAGREDELRTKLNDSDGIYEAYILRTIKDNHIEVDIFTLVAFFESLQACTTSKICDKDTAKTFFCNDATSFFHLHYRFLNTIRAKRNDTNFSHLLEVFAKKTCKE